MIISEIYSVENIKKNFPEILYKYRDWSDPFHKTILTNQELFFAAPDRFLDKNDCRFPIEWDFSFSFFKPILKANLKADKSQMLEKDYDFEIKNEYNKILGDKNK